MNWAEAKARPRIGAGSSAIQIAVDVVGVALYRRKRHETKEASAKLMHIHLDPVGGIAGDMFVAAMLNTWPDLADGAIAAVRAAGCDDTITMTLHAHDDGVLTGSRFDVSRAESASDHNHTHWSDLRAGLQASALTDSVKDHAIGIFSELADAEARVHGKDVEAVTFHEVGNWDSIADIVAAAFLIDALSPSSWSVGSLPIGRGRVQTAHGALPVPAPATSMLLEGFSLHDDGRSGERVTPTGAAILRYLMPSTSIGQVSRVLRQTGFGFGTKRFEGISNVLRVLAFDATDTSQATSDQVGIIQFEIDDQTGEDLAVALDRLRAMDGVIDVTQSVLLGKKNRMMAGIRILTKPSALDAVCDGCFDQTTTLGVRTRIEQRSILQRREVSSSQGHRVKIAARPKGETAKADIDDVAVGTDSYDARTRKRNASEHEALTNGPKND